MTTRSAAGPRGRRDCYHVASGGRLVFRLGPADAAPGDPAGGTLDDVIRELKALGWTREPADATRDGYDLAVWKAGRVVALIRPDPRGGLDVFRFDRH